MPDNHQQETRLRDYLALAPEEPVARYAQGASVRVIRSSKLPAGYVCLLLSLDPATLRSWPSRTLLVSEDKATPKVPPEDRASDGAHLQVIRRIVHAWLRASDAPKSERTELATQRVIGYMRAAEFATGNRNGWLMPVAMGKGYVTISHPPHSPAAFLEALQGRHGHDTPASANDWRSRRRGVPQKHGKHSPRADVYWVLETNRGHVLHIKSGGAVSDTIRREGSPPLPAGWSLRRDVIVSPGMRGSVLDRFRKIRVELDNDPNVSFEDKQKIRLIEEYIRNARKSPDRRS